MRRSTLALLLSLIALPAWAQARAAPPIAPPLPAPSFELEQWRLRADAQAASAAQAKAESDLRLQRLQLQGRNDTTARDQLDLTQAQSRLDAGRSSQEQFDRELGQIDDWLKRPPPPQPPR